MIKGYVSSDEDDYDDYDFGYSEPLILKNDGEPRLPEIKTEKVKKVIIEALNESKKIAYFFDSITQNDLLTLEELIEAGVSPDCTDSFGWTALIKACCLGAVDVVRFLLEHGADPNKYRELLTPLMACCTHTLVSENLKLECVSLLLEHGAKVNAKDKYGTTALMYACGSGYESIVTRLLQVPNINLNIQDKEEWSALFHAVNSNSVAIVKKLVEADIDTSLEDNNLQNASDLAAYKNFKEIVDILRGVQDEECDTNSKDTSLYDSLVSNLPNADGDGGFTSTSKIMLKSILLSEKAKKISLPALLNATDKDLSDIGIELEPERRAIFRGIHKYHLCPWKSSSMPEITKGVPLKLSDSIVIMGNVAKHLVIALGSIRYVKKRMKSRQTWEKEQLETDKKLITSIANAYEAVQSIHETLKRIEKKILKEEPKFEDDYIYTREEKKTRSIFLNGYIWSALGVALGGLVFKYCVSF